MYRNVSNQIKSINPQDVKEYVASLIAVLHLTNILQNINQRVDQPPAIQNESEEKENGQEKNQQNEASIVTKK